MFASDSSQREIQDAVFRMAYIAEMREGNNSGHLERVRGYAQTLGRGMGLPAWDVQVIATACQLHDIGKVGLPEALLLKTGGYNDTEWDTIKRHPLIGADILKNSSSSILQMGESIALNHHERWDGSGYPGGLIGEDIPLSARICAIADVFDALTTRRPYKQEMSATDALKLIKEAGGVLFDRQLVQVLQDEFEEIVKISKGWK